MKTENEGNTQISFQELETKGNSVHGLDALNTQGGKMNPSFTVEK